MSVQIYCIGAGDGFIKIGLSIHPSVRRAEFQTGNHRELHVLATVPLDGRQDPRAAEAAVHRNLRSRRIRGEWFAAEVADFMRATADALNSPIEPLPARTKTVPVASRGRGRPRIHPDRKAYKAEKERERRARKNAAPKPA